MPQPGQHCQAVRNRSSERPDGPTEAVQARQIDSLTSASCARPMPGGCPRAAPLTECWWQRRAVVAGHLRSPCRNSFWSCPTSTSTCLEALDFTLVMSEGNSSFMSSSHEWGRVQFHVNYLRKL
jgi:hypothetical protein